MTNVTLKPASEGCDLPILKKVLSQGYSGIDFVITNSRGKDVGVVIGSVDQKSGVLSSGGEFLIIGKKAYKRAEYKRGGKTLDSRFVYI